MRHKIGLCLLLLLSLLLGMMPVSAQPESAYKIIGYYPSWGVYDLGYRVTDIPGAMLTHINYAFAKVSDEGECIPGDEGQALAGNFTQLQRLKAQYPPLKTLISVGGWSWSDQFSDAALTAESRAKFARSCVAFMQQYGFDGIDIDWEYPTGGGMIPGAGRPDDTVNFTRLLAELRAQLDAQGAQDGVHYLLTIAAPTGPGNYSKIQLDQIHPYLDWINVMSYDFHGSWDTITNFNAPLYSPANDPAAGANTDAALSAYLAAGIPAEKLVVGVPFYGRGWIGVADHQHGLYQPASGPTTPDAFSYRDIVTDYLNRYPRYWQDEAQVPWLYSAEDGIMISYDDPESLAIKAAYVKDHGFGGVMFWELSQDSADHALLRALADTLGTP